MNAKISIAAVVVAAAATLALAGCGQSYVNAHDFNAPTPVRHWQPAGGWTRIETPGSFPSEVFACHGTDGIYVAQDASAPQVVRDDSNCKGYKPGA